MKSMMTLVILYLHFFEKIVKNVMNFFPENDLAVSSGRFAQLKYFVCWKIGWFVSLINYVV